MTGRPTVFTEQTLQKLEEAFALGCTDEEACLFANISPSSLYNHQRADDEFMERKQLLRHTPILKARLEVIKGFAGNPGLALKYLERKKSDEFSLRTSEHIEIKDERQDYLHPEMKSVWQECTRTLDSKLKEIKLREKNEADTI